MLLTWQWDRSIIVCSLSSLGSRHLDYLMVCQWALLAHLTSMVLLKFLLTAPLKGHPRVVVNDVFLGFRLPALGLLDDVKADCRARPDQQVRLVCPYLEDPNAVVVAEGRVAHAVLPAVVSCVAAAQGVLHAASCLNSNLFAIRMILNKAL